MSRLFISHSTNDKAAVEQFIDFLVLGMGISRSDIFCSSQKGTLPTGKLFMEKIREALTDCEKVICFLTPNYLRSTACLAEMWAAWYQTGKILPLLSEPLRFADLNNTPLIGLQMLQHNNPEDLTVLYDELRCSEIASNESLVEFNRQLNKYINSLHHINMIAKDSDGYYRVKIAKIRNTPPAYRCYKLDGLLQLDETITPGESHWIFYKTGMYEDLEVGDTIRLSVDSTELRSFHDLKNARNIYPKDMIKLS